MADRGKGAESVPFFESQRGRFCGLHALNNAVGMRAFFELACEEAAREVVAEAMSCALAVGQESEEKLEHHLSLVGDYSEQVLARVLQRDGRWVFDKVKSSFRETGVATLWEEGVVGGLVHLPCHWMALHRVDNVLWSMNSLHSGPVLIGDQAEVVSSQATKLIGAVPHSYVRGTYPVGVGCKWLYSFLLVKGTR